MAKYDVYVNTNGLGYLLDVQSDLLENYNSRVVVPLLPIIDAPKPAERLNPAFEIEGHKVVMVTQFMAAVPSSILKNPVTNVSDQFVDITNALDMVFQGF